MSNQPKLLFLRDIFTNPTTINIDLDAIRKEVSKQSERDELRRGQDWSFLSGQVVGAENPQGDYRAQ